MIANNIDTYSDEAGVIYSKDKKMLIKANPSLIEYVIPQGTEIIGSSRNGGAYVKLGN